MWYIILGIIILLILVGLYVGNYFFTIAIKKDSDWFSNGGHSMLNTDSEDGWPERIAKEYDRQQTIGFAFFDDAKNEDVSIVSNDGLKLVGKWIQPHPESNKWVICVHGYRSSGRRDMAYVTTEFAAHGFNTLVPDQRAHGNSEGKYIGMGYPEHLDVLAWINFLLERQPDAEIILFGCSMGSTTVAITLGAHLPKNVKLAIADCGYTSAKNEFGYVLKNMMKLPQQPILALANFVTKMRTGYSLYAADGVAGLQKNTLPVLFIHGDADGFVPTYMVYENEKATKGPHDLLVVEGASHFFSLVYDHDAYFGKIFTFIDTYFK